MILVLAALWVLWNQHEAVADALRAMRRPAPGYLAMLLAGVAANVILTGLMFSLLISPYGRVGRLEMQALIAAATLVNYLPLRPGLPGRILYHQAANRIRAVQSAKTIVQGLLISLIVVAYLATAILLIAACGGSSRWLWWFLLMPLPLLLAGALGGLKRLWLLAALVRYAEVFVWGMRYFAAFRLIGVPINHTEAILFACVSMIATLVPFVSNGLGLREWAIGLTSPLMRVGRLEQGITAELVNRAAEILVIVPLGLWGISYLASRRRAAAAAGEGMPADDTGDQT